jgi:hypothetical protein
MQGGHPPQRASREDVEAQHDLHRGEAAADVYDVEAVPVRVVGEVPLHGQVPRRALGPAHEQDVSTEHPRVHQPITNQSQVRPVRQVIAAQATQVVAIVR